MGTLSRAKGDFRGTPLSRDEFDSRSLVAVLYRPRAKYSWATGVAVGRFLTELKGGRIIARRCRRCERVVVPPRIFCEWCFRPNDEWVYIPDTGIVNTFSISHIAADTSRLKDPVIPAVVSLDGTTDGGLLHLIGEVKPAEVRIGMRVKAVWKKPQDRRASITDISHFKPM
jgi:hypothetical protein